MAVLGHVARKRHVGFMFRPNGSSEKSIQLYTNSRYMLDVTSAGMSVSVSQRGDGLDFIAAVAPCTGFKKGQIQSCAQSAMHTRLRV